MIHADATEDAVAAGSRGNAVVPQREAAEGAVGVDAAARLG